MQIEIRYGIKQEDALETRPEDAILNGMKYCSLKWNAFSFYWVHLSSFWWSHGRACIGLTQNLNIHQNQYDCSARYFMEIVISNAIVILKLYWKTSLKMKIRRIHSWELIFVVFRDQCFYGEDVLIHHLYYSVDQQ